MSNKVIAVLVFMIMMAAQSVFCGEYDQTNGLPNGRVFQDEELVRDSEIYAQGCIDTLSSLNPKKMKEIYPGCTNKDIVDAVKVYYEKNPTQRSKPIIQVLAEGCK
jgi:hypothetical protein